MKKKMLSLLLALCMILALGSTVAVCQAAEGKTLTSIAVTTPPAKTKYTAGETFSTEGMVVTATYSDGTTAEIKDYTVTPSGPLAVKDQVVVISYLDGTVRESAIVVVKVTADTAEPDIPFEDVQKSDYFYDAVVWVFQNSIMKGVSETKFDPNATLSRAMVVQVLYNKEGQPAVSDPNPFSDVPESQWFYNAVRWGAARNVVAGYGGGVFKPDDPVTIEQVCVILHNYAGKPKGEAPLDSVGQHSDWADPALQWAVACSLLRDVPFTNVTETANRAQTAQILANYPDDNKV